MSGGGWIGVDLDGTLAEYHGWKGIEHIGSPIPPMVDLVKRFRINGRTVKIFTARCFDHFGRANEEAIKAVEAWCVEHLGEVLPITCIKDFGMIELYDDRAVQVEINTGRLVGHSTR